MGNVVEDAMDEVENTGKKISDGVGNAAAALTNGGRYANQAFTANMRFQGELARGDVASAFGNGANTVKDAIMPLVGQASDMMGLQDPAALDLEKGPQNNPGMAAQTGNDAEVQAERRRRGLSANHTSTSSSNSGGSISRRTLMGA